MLDHVTIRTNDLAGTRDFLEKILDLKAGYRPGFSFPGHWLYADGELVVHPVPGDGGSIDRRGEIIDHVGFRLRDYAGYRRKLDSLGMSYFTMDLPELDERRLFIRTPAGILLELVFRERHPRLRCDLRPDAIRALHGGRGRRGASKRDADRHGEEGRSCECGRRHGRCASAADRRRRAHESARPVRGRLAQGLRGTANGFGFTPAGLRGCRPPQRRASYAWVFFGLTALLVLTTSLSAPPSVVTFAAVRAPAPAPP